MRVVCNNTEQAGSTAFTNFTDMYIKCLPKETSARPMYTKFK